MIEQQILREKFQEAQRGARAARTHLCYAWICLFAALVCFFLGWKMQQVTWMSVKAPWWVLLVPVVVSAVVAFVVTHQFRRRLNIVRALETRMPDLNGLLLTADELLDKPILNILERRVISQATDHAALHDWVGVLTLRRSRSQRWFMYLCLLLWINAFFFMNNRWERGKQPAHVAQAQDRPQTGESHFIATVSPGDVELEQGNRLIVEATFETDVPAEATLVVKELAGEERERIPMNLSVDGKVFGGLIPRVDKDANYQVEYAGETSKIHRITTFVYPALVRADVKITPPKYTGMPVREIKNTLKVTAIEDSDLTFTFKVNKPVKQAELFGEDKAIIPLKPSPADPTLLQGRMKAEKSQKYRLHLVDDHERANKNPPWLTVKVEVNQLAKIEVVFPKRDVQVSAIQELPVEARIWDDLGVTKSGVTFNVEGKSKEIVFKHGRTAPAKKQTVSELLALEKENAEPRQLVSYHFWAEDEGKDGEVRRAMSDMFFAEIRHFEDIFREVESQPGMEQKKGQLGELVDLQKQIVNATWKLMREANAGRKMETIAPDAGVVHESQKLALDKTKEAMEEVEDAEVKNFLTEAWKSMKDALTPLSEASSEKKRAALNHALGFEQTALEWLHRAQSREHRVARGNEPSAGQQSKQNQIMNLELKQDEQRYEEEKKATPEETAEQQENLQVLNRLKELARRQEALAEKIKELQKQIEKAKTPEEKLALENQLKRLQDEQEQLLRDVDELKERMESPENSANMAEAKEQLEQTREKVMEAAEKLKEQKLAEAANAAIRAQRDLEKIQEDFKAKTAKRFSEEMQQIRRQTREIADAQKQISETLENQKTPEASADTSAALEKMLDGSQVARKLEEQSGKVSELMENMRQISEQAELSNPLLHRRLYEAVRNAQTTGLEPNLDEAKLQSRFGNRAEAQEAERKVANSVAELQKNVEKAAESVLGSEVEALRMARTELDKLIEAAEGEAKSSPEQAGDKPAQNTAESGDSKSLKEVAGGDQEKPGDPKTGGGQDAPSESQASGKGQSKGEQGQSGVTQNDKPSQAGQGNSGSSDPKGQGASPNSQGEQESAGQMAGGPGNQEQKPGESESPGQSGNKGEPGNSGQMAGNSGGEGQQPGKSSESSRQGASGQNPSSSAQQQGGGMAGDPGRNPSGNEGQSGENTAGTQPNPNGGGGRTSSSGRTATGRNLGGDDRSGGLPQNVASGGGAMFFDEEVEAENRNPLTGTGYQEWTDRLRNVEELLNQPELRNEVAKVLDNAREMRVNQERNNMAPQVANLQMRITQPLIELRNRVMEELAKKDAGNPNVPVDRDPVPPAFRDLVKRYYKELGNGN